MTPPTIVRLRLDLRLNDHPALSAASEIGPVVPVFVWAPEEEGAAAPGAASRWWLHHSLAALDADFRRRGSRLILRTGSAAVALRGLARELGAQAVFWSRRPEPSLIARDAEVEADLRARGVDVRTFNSALLFEPDAIKTAAGGPFQVFTPFWNACRAREAPETPLPAPKKIPAPPEWPRSEPLEALALLPQVDWASGLRAAWTPGEAGARERLSVFLDSACGDYDKTRDRLPEDGVSRLSPHLHFGEVSAREVWHAVARRAAAGAGRGPEAYLRQLAWREFAQHLLIHFPRTVSQPLRPEFARFPWRRDARAFAAWTNGRTGYPVVDAGMRELWRTGWMHNRARMVTASFLVKDLLVDWRDGAAWFWDTLVDADLANNTLGWQWVAGCGADAAPYFRVFNPVLQARRFDPRGDYVRRWLPELASLSASSIHEPWTASPAELREAGVYPLRIVDHAAARERALAALSVASKRARIGA